MSSSERWKNWVFVRISERRSHSILGARKHKERARTASASSSRTAHEMERMISYLNYVKPKSEELVIDEMLAIRSEIDAWREKKASEEANARYNEMLYYGLTENDEQI